MFLQAYSFDMLGIGTNLCIFYECVLYYTSEKKSVQDCSATFGLSCFLFIGVIMYFHAFYSFYFLMFPYIVIDFYLMHVGTRLLTSTGMHLIPGLLSVCLMIVKVLEEVVHCR